jgi:hypothetical protein
MPRPPDLLHSVFELAKTRPLFHSEADFQHALAWHLHTSQLVSSIRLELPFRREGNGSEYLDLLAVVGGDRVAVELKYKTRRLTHSHADEAFVIQNHGAQDLGRYDFLLDVQRIERFVQEGRATNGLAVLLTNDQSYWSPASRGGTVDEMFRLNEGRVISGKLSWLPHASGGTTKGRTAPIALRGNYTALWHPYATVSTTAGGEFRVLAWWIG